MLDWASCFSDKRYGDVADVSAEGARNAFQRDYDRIIFSTAFRRLQNKTQVFPLPGSRTFVHNRLTHSLETASVGRSLGTIVGSTIATLVDGSVAQEFYRFHLKEVLAAACLAHDIGNPAFGHSGEQAISTYFLDNKDAIIADLPLHQHFSTEEWNDLINFEGNANALRCLTHHYHGKSPLGANLTYTTLASILKYTCDSSSINKERVYTKKYGFFQSSRSCIESIIDVFGLKREGKAFQRHPFVYLVEAADDICYNIIDLEDAHRIGVLPETEVKDLLLNIIKDINGVEAFTHSQQRLQDIFDTNESIAYLRAKAINALVVECARIFLDHSTEILSGSFNQSLLSVVKEKSPTLHRIKKISIEKIYNNNKVVEVEIAGFKVMSGLLGIFVPTVLGDKNNAMAGKISTLIPAQFAEPNDASAYKKVMSIVDFIAGMTDDYAMDLYRTFTGIDLPRA